jgi:hypothetical protein
MKVVLLRVWLISSLYADPGSVSLDSRRPTEDSDSGLSSGVSAQLRKLTLLWGDRSSRPVLVFSFTALFFAVVSVIYASASESLTLLAAGFRLCYTAVSFLIALNSLVVSRTYRPSAAFTYG